MRIGVPRHLAFQKIIFVTVKRIDKLNAPSGHIREAALDPVDYVGTVAKPRFFERCVSFSRLRLGVAPRVKSRIGL